MDQETFLSRVVPLWEARDFEGFIAEYDRCVEDFGGIGVFGEDVHNHLHGMRFVRWNALEQLDDYAAIEEDMARFLAVHHSNSRLMELVSFSLMQEGFDRFLDALEANCPEPNRILKAARCHLARRAGDQLAFLEALADYNKLPAIDHERRVFIHIDDLRFDDEYFTACKMQVLPDNNAYLSIRAEKEGMSLELELPFPENNAICEEGYAEVSGPSIENGKRRYTLNRADCEDNYVTSPFGLSFRSEHVKMDVKNTSLWQEED